MKFEDDEEDDHFLGYRFAVCPDCKKSFPTEPTSKELKEMNRFSRIFHFIFILSRNAELYTGKPK
jgi:hypothetical protein